MKRILFLLLLPALAFAQFGHGGGGASVSQMMAVYADSNAAHGWTAGSTTNRIKPRYGKSIQAESLFVDYAAFTSNVILNTVAGEQLKLGTGSDAAPELSSAGDVNTGIRFPGSDITTFVQGASKKMQLGADGSLTTYLAGTYSNGGRRHYFGPDTLALFNGAKTGRDSSAYVLPDGSIRFTGPLQSIGGNPRGVGAADLQVTRSLATQVASGSYSCTAGSYSTASATGSIAIGYGANATGLYSFAGGNGSLASLQGSRAHASGQFVVAGDAQFSSFVLRDTTLSSQSDTLKLDGSEAAVAGYLVVAANQALYFEGKVIAWCISGTKDNMAAAYKIEGLIQRDGAGNTTLVWSAVTDKYEHADLAAALSVTLSANDTKECLNIICAGMTEQTIRWVATIDAVQVGG